MTPLLLRKFNENTADRFSFLKLASVVVYIKAQRIDIELLYPEKNRDEARENAKLIINEIKKVIDSPIQVDVKLTMSHFDLDFFRNEALAFFDSYPSIRPMVIAENFTVADVGDVINIKLKIDESACCYIEQKKIDKKFDEYISNLHCETIKITYETVKTVIDESIFDRAEAKEEFVLEYPDGRFITPQNVEEFFGPIIYEPALYIEDCNQPEAAVVICGTISEMQELHKKPKENETEGAPFYKFTVSDFTGSIKCLIFPNKKNTDKLSMLKNGITVVLRGNTKQSTFRGETSIDVFVRDMSFCTLPENFEENRYLRVVPKEYKHVFPQPYVEKTQAGLFGQELVYIPQMLKGRTFVLFDLETTDKEPANAKIIEIAGAKIVDGMITETFNTFVNPKMEIPPRITALTSISDDDVVNAPTIDMALPDFYKFVDGVTLVGHNINGFDVPILNYRGKDLKIRFSNPTLDTYVLAQKYLKGKGLKNLKLGTIAEHYGFKNEHAHRADSDIIANYKMFLGMCCDIEKLGETV